MVCGRPGSELTTEWAKRVFVLASLVLASACDSPADDEGDSSDGLVAQIDPDCSLDGTFAVVIGEQLEGYTPLPEGAEPTLYHGAQGGTHLLLAAELTTPDPLDLYEVTLVAEIGFPDCVDTDCDEFTVGGQFTRVIEGTDRLEVYDDAVEIPYLFLVVDGWDPNRIRKVTLDVSDACGRSATDVRMFPTL